VARPSATASRAVSKSSVSARNSRHSESVPAYLVTRRDGGSAQVRGRGRKVGGGEGAIAVVVGDRLVVIISRGTHWHSPISNERYRRAHLGRGSSAVAQADWLDGRFWAPGPLLTDFNANSSSCTRGGVDRAEIGCIQNWYNETVVRFRSVSWRNAKNRATFVRLMRHHG
jgi:hypothetical protein